MIRKLAACAAFAALTTMAQAVMPVSSQTPAAVHIAVTADTLRGIARRTVTATDEGGHAGTYSGVSLRDVLSRAGVAAGNAVRGKAMTVYVVVGAADNYHVVFSLAELDPSFTDRVVLIAESRDGAPFAPAAGPYRLIVPGDKREARWVRQVTEIDVVSATP